MAVREGDRLGPYELGGVLGSGGMGVVYHGRDTRLDRAVAIKVLPDAFAADADRLTRFRREARALGALNHPNIAQIYAFEEADGTCAIVMELVDGEQLSDVIARGPMPLHDVVRTAEHIIAGLDAAHEQGIVHRDLKPANIKVRQDGSAKILDFGLAKSVAPSLESLASKETESHLTEAGFVLGTKPYMSPEQIRGGPVDKRTDIWAFGCVAFEMLAGRRAFDGKTATDIIGAIVRGEPDWSALPPTCPAAIRRLLRHCLQKDARERLRDIADARADLREATIGTPTATTVQSVRPPLLLTLGLAAALLATLPLAWSHLREQPDPTPLQARFTIAPPAGTLLPQPPGRLAVSPDGGQVVFAIRSGLDVRLVVRKIATGTLTPVPESDGVTSRPFWSPDGQWIAFAAGAELRRVNLASGASHTICTLPGTLARVNALAGGTATGTWNIDGTILFSIASRLYGSGETLYRVPAAGGQPVALTTLDATRYETEHAFPQFLPDGRHFLFLVRRKGTTPQVVAATLDSPGMRALIVDDATHASVVGSHVVFARRGVLYAQRFDHRTITAHGQPVALAENLAANVVTQGVFATGGEHVIAFENARQQSATISQFTWYDRGGKKLGTVGEPAAYSPNFSVTRDGRRFAFLHDGDVWAFDTSVGTRFRVTTDPAMDNDPVWSPDGLQVMFDSLRRGTFDVFVKTIGAPGPESLVVGSDQQEFIEEWSPDGRYAILVQDNDLVALSLEDRKLVRLTNDSAHQDEPELSPDGNWLAYSSDESGGAEIYIMRFPSGGIRQLVSSAGGVQPRWSGDGRELYYLTLDGTIMSVRINSNTGSPTSAATPLFKTRLTFITDIWDQHDVTNDGRFVVLEPVNAPEPGAITVLLNWRTSALQR